ncbi:phosphotransferase family protein [Glaciibacter flavus]|uniref:phosphotransferase family protein n=1 Tax=Orlajensenia flava TaxID=2565934 RepID=UPI003B004EB4
MTHGPAGSPPGVDVPGLTRWLEDAHPELAHAPLTATVIAGGRSNLTYRVDGARIPLVFRRPPLGHVLASAHDMHREHRIISALAGSAVPVPPAIAFVDDTEADRVTGTPFFVMALVEGRVLAHPSQNRHYRPAGLHHLGIELAQTLADLHAIDPASIGLADFGRPEGYLERQLRTWRRQYDASRSRELPRLDALQDALGDRMPASQRSGLVHGDYRLDNALVGDGDDGPRIAAILDWEMSTIGDPLVDLGMFGLYWTIADLPGALGPMPSAVDTSAGYPSFDELVDAYAAREGTSVPDLGWYRAFAAYKLAVIAEGIHLRWQAGETVGEGFDRIGALVDPLAGEGLTRLSSSTGRH